MSGCNCHAKYTTPGTPPDDKVPPCNCHAKNKGGHPRFYALLEELAELHHRKNADYSEPGTALGNLLAAKRVGLTPFMGVMVRLQDKFARIENLVRKGGVGEVKTESLRDTLIDNAVYSLLAIVLLEEEGKTA